MKRRGEVRCNVLLFFDLTRVLTSDTTDGFLSCQIGDVDEGIVE
jgi:hypothetical protein